MNKHDCIGYYENVVYKLYAYMNENKISELKVWCCKHYYAGYGTRVDNISPQQCIIKMSSQIPNNVLSGHCSDLLSFHNVGDKEYVEVDSNIHDGVFDSLKGIYITFDKDDCNKEYNNQIYSSINVINKRIMSLDVQKLTLEKALSSMQNKFIGTDYTIEKLLRG